MKDPYGPEVASDTGVQCIEERDGSDTVERQYVWGQYVDELIQYKKLVAPDAGTYYPLTDLLYRSVLLTKSDKTKHEAYDCDAYGNTLIYDTAGTDTDWFTDDDHLADPQDPTCQFIFTGRRYDPETSNLNTQIYFYRARYYHPALGRFLARDPIGYVDGMGLYEYVQSKPLDLMDANGLSAWKKIARWTRFAREMSLQVVRAVAWEIHGVLTGRRCCPGETRNREFRAVRWVCVSAAYPLPVMRTVYVCYDYGKYTWDQCDLRGYWRSKSSWGLSGPFFPEILWSGRAPYVIGGWGSFASWVARQRFMERLEHPGLYGQPGGYGMPA